MDAAAGMIYVTCGSGKDWPRRPLWLAWRPAAKGILGVGDTAAAAMVDLRDALLEYTRLAPSLGWPALSVDPWVGVVQELSEEAAKQHFADPSLVPERTAAELWPSVNVHDIA